MRQPYSLLICCAFVVLGCNSNNGIKNNSGPDMNMSVPPDMAAGPDMAMRLPDGVPCGTATCNAGSACCVDISTQPPTATCVASAAQCTTGSSLACDGPEDCSGATKNCCATVNFTVPNPDAGVSGGLNGATAACAADCQVTFSGSSATTRLCHADADCSGLSFASPFGTIPLTQCCSSTTVAGVHFCATALLSNFGIPVTCP